MKRLNDVNPMIFINGWILEDIDEVDFILWDKPISTYWQ
jgi:hypothetical protein